MGLRGLLEESGIDLLRDDVIPRDLPFYDASISQDFVAGMNRFARASGILKTDPGYDRIVATQFRSLWEGAS